MESYLQRICLVGLTAIREQVSGKKKNLEAFAFGC